MCVHDAWPPHRYHSGYRRSIEFFDQARRSAYDPEDLVGRECAALFPCPSDG
jgi:hypothetical protein